MPPRLTLLSTGRRSFSVIRHSQTSVSSSTSRRAIAIRSNACSHLPSARSLRSSSPSLVSLRHNSSKSDEKSIAGQNEGTEAKGPSQDALPAVSEEAAAFEKIAFEKSTGKKCDGSAPGSPELEQGTPVDEMFRRDKDAQKYAPSVLKKSNFGSRSFSTSALRHQELQRNPPAQPDPSVAAVAKMIAQATIDATDHNPGLKFDMPEPLPKSENFKNRYEPIVDQFTKLIMRDGKLATAQKNMAYILDHLRTASPPQPNPKRRLLTTLPPPQLPLNPILYLTLIVDSVAPLLKIRQQRGLAGGGASVQIPVPLAIRQRRRTAIMWIIDASDKRRDSKLAARIAQELVAVAEGRSGVWEKREMVHKLGVAGRSNLKIAGR